jgi:hypothetical protein
MEVVEVGNLRFSHFSAKLQTISKPTHADWPHVLVRPNGISLPFLGPTS